MHDTLIVIPYNNVMDTLSLFYRFGAALAAGLLIGLQREYAIEKETDSFAGVRTYTLLSLGGCIAAFSSDLLQSPIPFAALLLLFGSIIAISYYISARAGHIGATSEVVAILTFMLGAMAYWQHNELVAAVAVGITVILAAKPELERFARGITREDISATLKFAVITAIILPVLPNHSFETAPFDVLNPYKIWLMVVFISGISFLGYMLIKIVGAKHGIGLTGLLGGLVSSTAVTLSFSQRSKTDSALSKPFALAIVVAWTVMFARVIVEVAVLNRELLKVVWIPISAAAGAGLIYSLYLFFAHRTKEQGEVAFSNPFELKPAITFGLLYGLILLISKAAQMYLGGTGIYLSSILAGTTDVDAITLSMAELSTKSGGLDTTIASRAVVLAALSNTAVKGSIAFFSGSRALRKALLPGVLLILITGTLVAFVA